MSLDPLIAHLLSALAWLSFGLGHSWLATNAGRADLGRWFGAWARVAYNGIAVGHLGLVWLIGWLTLGSLPAFDLPAPLTGAMAILFWGGLVFLGYASLFYDLGRLSGLRQIRAARAGITDLPEDEDLRLDGPHQWVRHPLYLAGILILWGRAGDPFGLSVALWGSAYLVLGAWFEERRLLRLYGESYARYRASVPAFVPWPRRGGTNGPGPAGDPPPPETTP